MSTSATMPTPSTSSSSSPSPSPSPSQSLTRDPISLILPFLSFNEFVTSAVAISRVWYSTAKLMRSRQDESSLTNYLPRLPQGQAPDVNQSSSLSLFLRSSLRHHVAYLSVKLTSTTNPPRYLKPAEVRFPLQEAKFTEQVNQITHAMPNLISLTINAKINLVGRAAAPTGTVTGTTPASNTLIQMVLPFFPPHLRRLTFHLTLNSIFSGSVPLNQLCDAWLVHLFTKIAASESLCTSLRILECEVRETTVFTTSTVMPLHSLTQLKRLKLTKSEGRYEVDRDFIDAIRAIPNLTEFEGPNMIHISYLLRQPSVQSFTRLGKSALRGQSFISIRPENQVIGDVLCPVCLLASPTHDSLIELNALIVTPLSLFLPQLTHLRVLRVRILEPLRIPLPPHENEINGQIAFPPRIDMAEDAVTAFSSLTLIERLHIDWHTYTSTLTESHIERIIAPLLNLNYLVLGGQHSIHSLDFLIRSVHSINGLKYFSFHGRLSSLDSYRAIYSLSQLRLLHVCSDVPSDILISLSSLDAMFRPRHQLETSVPSLGPLAPPDHAATTLSSGQLPSDQLPYLCHFSQEYQHENVREWQKLANEADKVHQNEIMQQEA